MVEPYQTADNSGQNGEGEGKEELPKDYSDKLIELYILKTLNDTDDIWYYDTKNGVFVPNAEPILKAKIEDDLGRPYFGKDGKVRQSTLSTHDVNEYIAHIQRRTYIKREDFNPSLEWIAAENCMLNLKTGKTAEFSPDFMNTTRIPVRYVEYNSDHVHTLASSRRPNGIGDIADFFRLVECPCPKIMKFLNEIITPEDIGIVLDFMAYCLWRTYTFNAWMLFNGAGLNGKSIFLDLVERFFGSHNVSGETLDRLLKRKVCSCQSIPENGKRGRGCVCRCGI